MFPRLLRRGKLLAQLLKIKENNIMLKELIAFIIGACLLITCSFAATVDLVPTVNEKNISVDITLDEFPEDIVDVSSVTIRYEFDKDKLTYIGTMSTVFGGSLTLKEGGGYIGWFDSRPDSEDSFKVTAEDIGSSPLFTITFSAVNGAAGEAAIDVTFLELADSSLNASKEVEFSDAVVNLGGDNADDDDSDNEDTEDDKDDEDSDNESAQKPSKPHRPSNTQRPSNNTTPSAPVVTTPPAPAVSVQFADIPSDNWAYTHAKALFDKGIISGDGSEKPAMRPEANITREEAAKIALLAMGVTPQADLTLDFNDADTVSDWAKSYIATAVKHGILKGSNGNVRAKELITREEMITILSRAFAWNVSNDSLSFADSSDVSDWAKANVAYANTNGILTGYSDNTVKPKATITRAETFALVSRCISK